MVAHHDSGDPKKFGASSIFTWDFAVVMYDAEDLCSVNTAYEPESSFTTSPRTTTRPLYFLKLFVQFCVFEMTKNP